MKPTDLQRAIDCSRSQGAARLVLWSLAFHADADTREAWPGLPRLMSETGMHRKSVQRGVDRLLELGEVVRLEPSPGYTTNRYYVAVGDRDWRDVRTVVREENWKIRLRREVMERDGRACRECGSRERLTIDHVVPQRLGGAFTLENLQVLCVACNSRKGATVGRPGVLQTGDSGTPATDAPASGPTIPAGDPESGGATVGRNPGPGSPERTPEPAVEPAGEPSSTGIAHVRASDPGPGRAPVRDETPAPRVPCPLCGTPMLFVETHLRRCIPQTAVARGVEVEVVLGELEAAGTIEAVA